MIRTHDRIALFIADRATVGIIGETRDSFISAYFSAPMEVNATTLRFIARILRPVRPGGLIRVFDTFDEAQAFLYEQPPPKAKAEPLSIAVPPLPLDSESMLLDRDGTTTRPEAGEEISK